MVAVILAGGQGTRLLPITNDLPKALLPIGGKPVVRVVLERLKRSGVTTIYMAINHRADQIKAALGDGSETGLEILYSIEQTPLSTVGPLKLIDNLPEQFIVMNADILTDLDVGELSEFHANHDAALTVAIHKGTERIDFGVITTDSDGIVTEFREKPEYEFSVSMGVYVFSRRLLKSIPSGQRYGFDDLMRDMLSRGEKVATYPYDGYWLDIGRPNDYEQAKRDFENVPGSPE